MVRFAKEQDLDRINEIRAQVSALHAAGRPDIFKPGFCQELRDRAGELLQNENSGILVAERDGVVCGMACVEYLVRPESAYCQERRTYYVSEFGVDEAFRRRGVGRELLAFMRKDALDRGFFRIELDAWTFNGDALKFYEAAGFQTFRKFMEWDLTADG
ncbi:MAG: GNAT family N-acetyltransferase [Oscillospiraceae bacterium]|nr:GNAT family N-acetyltransferase [Oscillospiraceae bacterium]